MLNGVDRIHELTLRLTEQGQQLIRLELQLAQAELAGKAKNGARAAAFAAGAGVFLFFAVFAFMIAGIWGLASVMPVWAAGLVIGGVLVLLAALVGLLAVLRAKRAGKPVPEMAIANVKAIPTDLKTVAAAAEAGADVATASQASRPSRPS